MQIRCKFNVGGVFWHLPPLHHRGRFFIRGRKILFQISGGYIIGEHMPPCFESGGGGPGGLCTFCPMATHASGCNTMYNNFWLSVSKSTMYMPLIICIKIFPFIFGFIVFLFNVVILDVVLWSIQMISK